MTGTTYCLNACVIARAPQLLAVRTGLTARLTSWLAARNGRVVHHVVPWSPSARWRAWT